MCLEYKKIHLMIHHMDHTICHSVCLTENGDKAYATSGSKCLDFFVRITRSANVTDYVASFVDALSDNTEVAFKLLLNLRDIRGGKGEKLIPIVLMVYLKNVYSRHVYQAMLEKFVEYGCWKDVLRIVEISNRLQMSLDPSLSHRFIDNSIEYNMFAKQLQKDFASYTDAAWEGGIPAISLCAKWAPSEKTHYNKDPVCAADHIMKIMKKKPKQYRYMLGLLREHLNILERLMSTGQTDKIDFSKIPSIAMSKMKKSFTRDTNADGTCSEKRTALHQSYQAYLTSLTAGETKVNVKGIQPHQLVNTYLRKSTVDVDPLVEAQWSTLVSQVRTSGTFKNTIAVVDTSGSMDGEPLQVAIALGLLVAECSETTTQKVITFNETPRWHTLSGSNLKERVACMDYRDWGGNTNMKKTFDLILQDAIEQELPPAQMASTLIIFTDMQFDSANGSSSRWESTFETAQREFLENGYALPKIVCWNLRTSCSKSLPVQADETGYVMLSGFSSELLKHVLNGDDLTPLTMMLHVLEPYQVPTDNIQSIVSESQFTFDQLQSAIDASAFKKAYKKGKSE